MSSSCLESQGCHLIPLSYLSSCFFCLVLHFLSCQFSANGPFSRLFFQKTQIFFGKGQLGFCVWLLLSSWEMIVGRWYVQLAATWHLYLPLQNIFLFYIVSVYSFFIFFFNLVSINQTEWLTISACPSLMCSFNRGNIEGTNSSKKFMFAK